MCQLETGDLSQLFVLLHQEDLVQELVTDVGAGIREPSCVCRHPGTRKSGKPLGCPGMSSTVNPGEARAMAVGSQIGATGGHSTAIVT